MADIEIDPEQEKEWMDIACRGEEWWANAIYKLILYKRQLEKEITWLRKEVKR